MHLFNCTFNNWRYLSYCWIIIALCISIVSSGYHLILDPAGDCKNIGRTLATCYERSITMQLCEELKKKFILTHSDCIVTITHGAGECLQQEQRAQIANKSNAELFVHISCFEDTAIKPHIMIYYYENSNILTHNALPCQLIPAHKAYTLCLPRTKKIGHALHTHLKKESLVHTIMTPCGIPDARLKYIQIPSCTLEIGVSRSCSWTTCIESVYTALVATLESIC